VDVSNTMLNKCNTLIAASLDAVSITDSVSDLAWEVESLDEFEKLGVEHIAKIRAQLGEAKVDPTLDYILEQEQLGVLPHKLVIFAHHRKVIEKLVDALNFNGISASLYYGGMNDEQKNNVVQSFQHGETRVFVGSIVAAGVGLTLTVADTAIILEPSYVPAENVQAEDRLHRIGAQRPVLIQYITLANSLDHRILTLVVEKMKMVEELFG
jgi:SNF2 family DNA or RNA helicase